MVNLLSCWFFSSNKQSTHTRPQSCDCCWIPPPRLKWWRPIAPSTVMVTMKPTGNMDELRHCFKSALVQITKEEGGEENSDNKNRTWKKPLFSKRLAMALLQEPYIVKDVSDLGHNTVQDGKKDRLDLECNQHDDKDLEFVYIQNNRMVFKSLPRRPYYKELSQRLWWLMKQFHGNNDDDDATIPSTCNDVLPRPLVNAEELNMRENSPPPALIPMPDDITVPSCQKWLHDIGECGIREIMGLRHTVGTNSSCLPPDQDALMASARVPCKPSAKPPHLTVAARARSKHAHRGSEQFYGIATGTIQKKNEDADLIVREILRDAVWINIHEFGGVNKPVLELRNERGYGMRWSGDWSCPERPVNLTFRGFLEPHREDGFENNWRH